MNDLIEAKTRIPKILEEELPKIINKIAKEHNISPYINNPDFLEERLCSWHQFGLLTHTQKVRSAFSSEINEILKKWRLYNKVENYLSRDVEGIERKNLFE